MSTSDFTSNLLAATVDAIERSLDAIRLVSGDELAGYALCTDDALGAVFPMAVTVRQLAEAGAADLLFSPTDWPIGAGADAFAAASRLLLAHQDESPLRDHVDKSFDVLVQALLHARRTSRFDESVFLSVLSTDPSDYLESLEARSVQTLNPEYQVAARQAFLQKWS